MNVNDCLLIIYPALWLFLTFYKAVLYKGDEFSPSMWNREQVKLLQGVSCVGVILHHLTQMITSYGSVKHGPITIFSSMGILFTSVFFFSTGFGLITSVYNNPDYLKTFLRHRLSIVLIPFFTANTIYTLLRIYYKGIAMSKMDIARSVLGLVLLNGNGWYIVEVVYLYLIFYILFRLIKKKDIALVLLCVATIVMIRYALVLGHDYSDIGDVHFHGEWWYNSTIVFVMGIIFARFKNGIVSTLKKNYKIIVILTALLFVVAFVIEEKILVTHGYYRESYVGQKVSDAFITLVAQMVLCLFSTFLVLLINMKISIGNKVVKGLSVISTELFLIHQVFVSVIFNFSKVDPFYIYAVVLLCSIPAAIIVHFINKPLILLFQDKSILRRLLTKRNKMIIAAIAILIMIFVALRGLRVLLFML
ncbi:MAG: acyltransferase [Lachnospiraceae bacterium]|nr:acyltransferase [Lachnospiraceae bacterium]